MKAKEFYEKVVPMVEQIESKDSTTLFMLMSDNETNSGVVKGKAKELISMLLEQMTRQDDIAMLVMAAAEGYMDYLAEEQKKDAKGKQQKLS